MWYRGSTAIRLPLVGSSPQEAEPGRGEFCHPGAETGAAGRLQPTPPGSSAPALPVSGERY